MKTSFISCFLAITISAAIPLAALSQSCSPVSFKKILYENDSTMFAANTVHYLQTTSDSAYFIGGTKITKTDLNGNILWNGGSNTDFSGQDAIPYFSPDGRYLVLLGNFKLINVDANETVLWQKQLVDTTCFCMHPKHITQTSDGGFIITGYKTINDTSFYRDRIFVVKTNYSGDTTWTRTISKSPYDNDGYYAQETSDGGYLILANVEIRTNALPDYKIGILKLNNLGQEQWYKTAPHSIYYQAAISGIKTADSACVFVSFGDSIAESTYFLKVKENGDQVFDTLYIGKKFNGGVLQQSNGNYLLGMQDSLSFVDAHTASILSSTAYLGVAGENIPIVAIRPTCDNGYMLSGNSAQFRYDNLMCGSHYYYYQFYSYLIKTDNSLQDVSLPSGVNESIMDNGQWTIFPNPTTNELRIRNYELGIKNLKIMNVMGECVYQSEISNPKSEITIDVSSFAKGIYFVQITLNGKLLTKKLIVQ